MFLKGKMKRMFEDRQEAGKKLAQELLVYKDKKNLLVLAIPRGGVVVGKELSRALNCPLDVLVTKKIGAPGNPELAIGAVGPKGLMVLNKDLALRTGADQKYLDDQKKVKSGEVRRKMRLFNKRKRVIDLKGKRVILTDDGIATGATIEVAIKWIKAQKPKKVVLAVPVAAPDSLAKLTPLVDEVVCLEKPFFFAAVGQFYQTFPQTTSEEVVNLLKEK